MKSDSDDLEETKVEEGDEEEVAVLPEPPTQAVTGYVVCFGALSRLVCIFRHHGESDLIVALTYT